MFHRVKSVDHDSVLDWPEMAAIHFDLNGSLRRIADQTDSLFRDATITRLAAVQEELRNLAAGRIVFSATEAWRTVYDQILKSPEIALYRSVAWMRSEDYWQDSPGRRSMQLNYVRLREGVAIERILILDDFFWPEAATAPAAAIGRWIAEQHRRGIVIWMVRESTIAAEPDLLCDIGIYGNRAVGTLELDPQCRTVRFTFDFSPEGIRLAEERWKRLLLYATTFAETTACRALPRKSS